jgi:hypothetical protein
VYTCAPSDFYDSLGHASTDRVTWKPVPSQNPIRVATMADGGGVGQAPIALDCLRSLLTWGIVT